MFWRLNYLQCNVCKTAIVQYVLYFNHFYFLSFFFESVTWDETEVGFEKVPGGDAYANRSVISFHFYDPPEVIELR